MSNNNNIGHKIIEYTSMRNEAKTIEERGYYRMMVKKYISLYNTGMGKILYNRKHKQLVSDIRRHNNDLVTASRAYNEAVVRLNALEAEGYDD